MRPELETLARERLSYARESLAEGRVLLKTAGLRGAVNRFYYSAFYAARSLLATRELDSSKHTGVISLFQQHFVKTQLITPEMGLVLRRAFETRLDTDYADYSVVTPEAARQLGQDAERFIEECSRLLDKLIAEDENRGDQR